MEATTVSDNDIQILEQIKDESLEISARRKKQLAEFLASKDYFETLLLDMLRDHQLSQQEYDKMMAERSAAYIEFKKDLQEQ